MNNINYYTINIKACMVEASYKVKFPIDLITLRL